MFTLGERLLLCASMVRPDTALADVGTDHAYLPIWLASRRRIRRAVAADLRPGPLERARENILRCGVQELVTTRLSDGLSAIDPGEAEDVVVAGMGGETIARILSGVPWLKQKGRRLILQPMTSAPALRLFLAAEGFALREERAAEEDGRVYSAMLAEYDPEKTVSGPLYPYIGVMSAETRENRAYMARRAAGLKKRAQGLSVSGREREAGALLALADELERKGRNAE